MCMYVPCHILFHFLLVYVVVSPAYKEDKSCIIFKRYQNCLCKTIDLYNAKKCSNIRDSHIVFWPNLRLIATNTWFNGLKMRKKYQPPINIMLKSTGSIFSVSPLLNYLFQRWCSVEKGILMMCLLALLCSVLSCRTGYNYKTRLTTVWK